VGGDVIGVSDVREYVRYLGFHPGDRDCKSAGSRGYLIPCPFHNDTNPSMAVYEDGAWCFSGCGGKYYNLAYLASEIKGISYCQALKDLGAERLEASEKMVDYRPTEILHFCEPNPDKYVKAFQNAHAKCSTEYPPEMVEWLERKKLTEVAKKLDWRWHDGTVYKQWGKGIVIPYQDPSHGGAIVYERFRAWNEKEHKFEKVISPVGTNSVPYLATFRSNKRQWICEGECLTPDTEVLTEKGWVRFDEYDGESRVAQWDDGKIDFVKPSAFVIKNHIDGRIFNFESKGVSFATTPKHRIVGMTQKAHTPVVMRAEDLYVNGKKWLLPRCGEQSGTGLSLTDAQIRLAVAVSADFSERKYSWYCTLKKGRKIERLLNLLESAGVKYVQYEEDKYGRVGFQIWEKPRYLSKVFDFSWLSKMTVHQKLVMLKELQYWDGNLIRGREYSAYNTVLEANAVFVQTLAHLSGVCATIIKRERDIPYKKNAEWFVVDILWGKQWSSLQKYREHTTITYYTGRVYCVSVPSTFFLIRHNGHIVVTGNTDTASLFALGESALGVPGSTAKKVVNTIIAMLNDIDIVEEVIVCGDEDAAGQGMNMYVEEAVRKIAPRLRVSRYEHVLHENKADMSDEYVKGVLRLPNALIERLQGSTAPNSQRVKDTFDFSKYVDGLDSYLKRCEAYGVDPWVKNKNGLEVLNETAISDSLVAVVEEHYVVIKEARGSDVLIPKLAVSGVEHFILQVDNGEHAGIYDVLPGAIACGWTEEQKDESGAIKMMLGIQCKDLVNIEDLDFKE